MSDTITAQVRIDGVPTLGWGRGRECTFLGAVEAATAATRFPQDYVDMMGWTALAFRTRWFVGKEGVEAWCASSPVGEFPEEFEAVQQATGWRLHAFVRMDREKDPHMEDFTEDVRKALDSGTPVMAYDEQLNMAVLAGYAGEGQDVLMHAYSHPPRMVPMTKVGPMVVLLKDHETPLPPREALVKGLTQAVHNWRRPAEPVDKGAYLYGRDALERWRDDIGRFDTLSEEDRKQLHFVGWWCFDTLVDARAVAGSFLRKHGALLGEAATADIAKAAKQYDEEAGLLRRTLESGEAFLGPWTGKNADDWTEHVAAREREVLAEAVALEEQAIAALERALAATTED